jgi:hypothetical protein
VFEIDIIKLRHKLVHKTNRINNKKVFVKESTFLSFMTIVSNWIQNIDSMIMNDEPRKRTVNFSKKYYREIMKLKENPILEIGKLDVIFNSVFILDKIFDIDSNDEIYI